jgi:predicted phage terminase large subunit-like protein
MANLSRSRSEPRRLWEPNPGRQAAFVSCSADEVLWGGEAGGGKSGALVALPLRWCHHPGFNALVLRREASDLGPLLAKAQRLYPGVFPGAQFNGTKNVWTFPSGARVRFNHCQHESDAFAYQGDEFNFIGWDELTHFTLMQYAEINSRLRTTHAELPCISRATSNPGGPGHAWVFARWGAWLDPETDVAGLPARRSPEGAKVPPATEGQFLHFEPEGYSERAVPDRTEISRSRTFFRSVRAECTQLQPGYEAQLNQLDPVRRAQLKGGNWLAKPAAGKYFQRTWVKEWLDAPPQDVTARVRYWDLAAGGDYAAGFLYSRWGRLWVAEDMVRLRGTPHQVRASVFATAKRDGKSVWIWVERDPGQAGKDQEYSYVSAPEMQGYAIRFRPKRVDKVTAFQPFSAQAEAGLVAFVRGAWNVPFFEEAEAFPEGDFDDQCDTASGAHAVLTGGVAEFDEYAEELAASVARRDEPSFFNQLERDEIADGGAWDAH